MHTTNDREGLLQATCADYAAGMDGTTTRRIATRSLTLPNALTYARISAVPAVVAAMYCQDILQGGLWLRWVALAIFIAAGVTDILDGYFARVWGQQSSFGRMLDPITETLRVSAWLLL